MSGHPDPVESLERRGCGICGCLAATVLFRQRFSPISTAGFLRGYDVSVCEDCGFVYADRLPEQAIFDAYYRDLSKYEHPQRFGRESDYDRARYRAISEVLLQTIPSRANRIMEVGCATGGLLGILREHGYSQVYGLDPSPACAEAAKKLYGIPVMTGALADMAQDVRFDALILVGVVEHIRDLQSALNKLHGVLSDGGMVYVEVPDASRYAESPDAPFQHFSSEHINFFSPISLMNLMAMNGFRQLLGGTAVRRQSSTTNEPAAYGVFEVSSPSRRFVRDDKTAANLADYIQQSRSVEKRIHGIIEDILRTGRRILVWGVGTHTQRLLATSDLGKAHIGAFVDSNPIYQGKQLEGRPILPPEALRHVSEPILISSRVFQQEIQRQIRDDLGLSNDVILLYEL